MKIQFKKVVLPIDLGEYHESYAGQTLQVWVNPPREKRREREQIIAEYSKALAQMMVPVMSGLDTGQKNPAPTRPAATPGSKIKQALKSLARPFTQHEQDDVDLLNRKMFIWMIEIWNQHEDVNSRWSLDEVLEVYNTDPALYQWMTKRTIELMDEFRAGQKKV